MSAALNTNPHMDLPVKMEDINTSTLIGKQQRGELLVLLKERAGLTYKEIHGDFEVFGDLKITSLREVYRTHKGGKKGF